MTEPAAFGEWCVVELMGRRQVVGHVTEATIAGHQFLRVDVLAGAATITQYYAPGSVYAIHPTSEADARRIATAIRPYEPVSRWELETAERRATATAADMEHEVGDGHPY